jgi:hypothetical protein
MKLRWMVSSLFLALSCCACTSAAMAGTPPVPIEGKILVSATNDPLGVYFIEGMSDNRVPAPAQFVQGEVSPYADRVAYSFANAWPVTRSDVTTARTDGSDIINLTALAGLGGVNCNPVWSPDARQIAFQHADPTADLVACKAGFHVWVVNADGTGAHPVTPADAPTTTHPVWAPNGDRLACWQNGLANTIAINADGTGLVLLPNVGDFPDWSRDGASIISTTYDVGTDNGQTGMWRRILLTGKNGTNPRVLFERFISDADVATQVALYGSTFPAGVDPAMIVRVGVGPSEPRWSPTATRILFRAALPLDPAGLLYAEQVELWLLDVATGDLTRITNNQAAEYYHSWDGDNTLPDHPSVTVDNTTVTFSQVLASGVTTIILDNNPPALPTSYLQLDDFYQITSTAQVTGPATVAMSYAGDSVAAAAESHIAMLLYDAATAQWENITTSRDASNKVISGEASELRLMGLAYPLPKSDFSDVTSSTADPYWALWEIEAAYAAGIVKGYSDGTYKPTDPVTRDQMAVYISRALAGGDANVPAFTGTPSFSDVPADYWAFKYVEYAVSKAVVKGYSDGTYKPTDQVTRDQMSVFIARAIATPADGADLVNYAPPATPTFPDVSTTFWAYKYVEYIAQPSIGVTNGYPDGDYHPEYICTRDQMAVYVARAFKLPV